MATIPEAVRPMVQQLLARLEKEHYTPDSSLDEYFGKAGNYIRRGLGDSSVHLADLARIRDQRYAGVIDDEHFRHQFEDRKMRLAALLRVVDEDLQLASHLPRSDEERARELIAELRVRALDDKGNFHVVRVEGRRSRTSAQV